jgi:hypothetical protein
VLPDATSDDETDQHLAHIESRCYLMLPDASYRSECPQLSDLQYIVFSQLRRAAGLAPRTFFRMSSRTTLISARYPFRHSFHPMLVAARHSAWFQLGMMLVPAGLSALTNAVRLIIGVGPWSKMRVIAARRIVTDGVANQQRAGIIPGREEIGDTVSGPSRTSEAEPTVAISIVRPRPRPALIRAALINFAPEAFYVLLRKGREFTMCLSHFASSFREVVGRFGGNTETASRIIDFPASALNFSLPLEVT